MTRLVAVPPASPARRVLVADDHALFAEALMLMLSTDERIDVVGSAANGAEAVALTTALLPDVVVMDVEMPALDGIAATRRVRNVAPGTRVVILTAERSHDLAEQALAAGAERYLTKDVPAAELIEAILDSQPSLDAYGGARVRLH